MEITFKNLLVGFLFWFTPTLIFLPVYIGVYYYEPYSVIAHLYVVIHLVLIAITLKYLSMRIFGRRLAIAIGSLIQGSFIFSLSVYYCLVVVGLGSWHRVITKELITSYAYQLPQLCEAYNVAWPLLLAISLSVFLAIVLCSAFAIKRLNPASQAKKLLWTDAVMAIFLLILVYRLCFNVLDDVFGSEEPFSLTLVEQPTYMKQSTDPKLNVEEIYAKSHYLTSKNAEKKNVIIIVVDALRPDHMGIYGYSRDTTPFLSTMQKTETVNVIKNVKSSCGESACGLSSMGSSRFVHQLPDHPFTLQQVLQRYGYQTYMILGGDHTNFYNLRDKYGHVDHYFDGSMAKGFYMNDDRFVIKKTSELPKWDSTPAIIQYHLMSTHILGLRQKQYEKFLPFKKYDAFTKEPTRIEFINSYDNGVLQTDAMIAELISTLKSKNYLDNAIVVITADHGEGLGEHGKYSHANSVREELLRIPLVFISYGKSTIPETHERLVSQIDIAPTILKTLNISAPNIWSGHPLQNYTKRDFIYFQLLPDAGLFDLRDQDNLWKYWKNSKTNQEFVFNLKIDPHENNNFIQSIPENLKNEWRERVSSTLHNSIVELNPRQLKQIIR